MTIWWWTGGPECFDTGRPVINNYRQKTGIIVPMRHKFWPFLGAIGAFRITGLMPTPLYRWLMIVPSGVSAPVRTESLRPTFSAIAFCFLFAGCRKGKYNWSRRLIQKPLIYAWQRHAEEFRHFWKCPPKLKTLFFLEIAHSFRFSRIPLPRERKPNPSARIFVSSRFAFKFPPDPAHVWFERSIIIQ